MPVYEFTCKCKNGVGEAKVHTFYKPMSRAADIERCNHCKSVMQKLYSVSLKKEFFGYYDDQYGTQISSEKEEKRLMKKHGHVSFRETAAYESPRWRSVRKQARKKPMYFTSAGASKVERD